MARYRKIDVKIWNDAKFNSLPIESKLIFMYLLTAAQTLPIGAVPITEDTVQKNIGLDPIPYGIGYSILSRVGIITYDERGLFFIKNWFKYNPPENPKVVISWSQYFDVLPECPLLPEICSAVVNACQARGLEYIKNLDIRYREISNTVFDTVCHTVSDTVPDIKEERRKNIYIKRKCEKEKENPTPENEPKEEASLFKTEKDQLSHEYENKAQFLKEKNLTLADFENKTSGWSTNEKKALFKLIRRSIPCPPEIPGGQWLNFLEIRRQKRSQEVSPEVWSRFLSQAEQAGLDAYDALIYTIASQWQSFTAKFYFNAEGINPQSNQASRLNQPQPKNPEPDMSIVNFRKDVGPNGESLI